jgi:heme/copper-type cytochrome/quinol oxidase subunit 2
MNPLKNNAQRAKAVNIVFIILLVFNVVTIISDIMQLNLIKDLVDGKADAEAAGANDLRVTVLAVASFVVLICSIVFFILWFRRAYNNLSLTNKVYLDHSEGWAAGAWFVPFLNLVRPYQIMVEIWNKTQEATSNLLSYKPGTLVGWWWAIYILSNVINNITTRIINDNSSIDGLTYSTYAQIITNGIEVISIVVTMVMVKKAAELEAKLYESYQVTEGEQVDLLGVI